MNKKLLLIMPKFFEYPQIITKELEAMGYDVDYFDDRPSTNQFVKAFIRINRNILDHYIDKYYDHMMQTVLKKQYDVVFVISGQSLCFDEKMMSILRRIQNKAKFVLYQWDSLNNFPYIRRMAKYFDKAFSFDREDCKNEDYLNFLPLFYCRQYEEMAKKKKKIFKYDFFFVGTAHPKKYRFIKQITNELKDVYDKQFIYMYLPGWILFYFRKLTCADFKNAKYEDFKYKPLSSKDLNEVMINSRCVLDSAQDGQLGLTIRVLETLGAKKKLITTNEDVVNYDFYKPENIYVYKDKADLNNIFFKSEYVDIDPNIYKKYSLRNWLKTILD